MTTTSYATTLPYNQSLLQTTKYTFFIADHPYLRYFCQTVSLPSISTTAVPIPTPFSTTWRHGDKLVFEPFTVTALVDEDLRVWEETYKWMVGLTRPSDYCQYRHHPKEAKEPPLYYDGALTINTNANRPNLRLKFYDCHPVELGAINFDTKSSPDNTPTFDITFRYDIYEIERIPA
jgi:hypothetical protein